MASRVAIQRHGIKGFALRVPYYTRRYRTYIDLLKRPVPSSGTHEFVAAVPQIRSIRLHPDLAGGGEMIEAKVSVVIPTLNAGSEFVLMLRKLRSQKSIKEIEEDLYFFSGVRMFNSRLDTCKTRLENMK